MSKHFSSFIIVAGALALAATSAWLLRMKRGPMRHPYESSTSARVLPGVQSSSLNTSPVVRSSVSNASPLEENRPHARKGETDPTLPQSPPGSPRAVLGSVSKKMVLAYQAETLGHVDEALDQYRAIAEQGRGSDQIGALNRYIFAMQRKHGQSDGLKVEVDRLKARSEKTDFEWMFLSQFGSEVDLSECYREVIANPSSPFVAYAKVKLAFHYDPRKATDVKAFARKAKADLQSFIDERPLDPLMGYAKLLIASCLEEIGEHKAAVDVYNRLLQTDDLLVRAHCIHNLSKQQQVNDPALVQTARLIMQFYGEWGDGYFMPEGFDPERGVMDVSAATQNQPPMGE